MISKAQIKLIKSLNYKKYRKKNNLFIAEGVKIINELILSEYKICTIYATIEWIEENITYIKETEKEKIQEVSNSELKSISSLTTPNNVIALVYIPGHHEGKIGQNVLITIALDGIRDPGNLGTIIRIADWYKIDNIICSPDCADIYNPKVVQASMGSIFHTKIIYRDLKDYLTNTNTEIYGGYVDGKNIHQLKFKEPLILVIGNEATGISDNLAEIIGNKICIPGYGKAESLNAAVATGIILDKIRKDIS